MIIEIDNEYKELKKKQDEARLALSLANSELEAQKWRVTERIKEEIKEKYGIYENQLIEWSGHTWKIDMIYLEYIPGYTIGKECFIAYARVTRRGGRTYSTRKDLALQELLKDLGKE